MSDSPVNAASLSRRGFCSALGAAGLATSVLRGEPPNNTTGLAKRPATGDEALQLLIDGNKRFVEGTTHHPHEELGWRKMLRGEQHPFAVILGCSDSRVPPELLFDQGFGDLFVIRVAGNVVAPDVLGSIQYAFAHLDVQLLVVLGHEGCGAVTAAVDAQFHHAREPERIETLVRLIEPGLKDLNPTLPRERLVRDGVDANVRWTLQQLVTLPEYRRAMERHPGAQVVGAVYELTSGNVRRLDRPAVTKP